MLLVLLLVWALLGGFAGGGSVVRPGKTGISRDNGIIIYRSIALLA
jgi:hypothetical protein